MSVSVCVSYCDNLACQPMRDYAVMMIIHVDPNISRPGASRPTSDITRLLKDSPYLERITDMDLYSQNATNPLLNHPDFFAQVR